MGVTGTNGKTTLTYLLGHIMTQLGEKNVLLGNMGDSLSNIWVVVILMKGK